MPEEPTLYLCKFWGLDDLLYVIGDESSLDEWSLNEIADDVNNIYFLVELEPV